MADAFRVARMRREAAAIEAITNAYRDVLIRIDADIRALELVMDTALAAGEPITSSMIWRERRLERLQAQALNALVAAGAQARDLIEDARWAEIRAAAAEADALLEATFLNGPRELALTLSSAIPEASVIQIVAATQPATPLTNLLATIAQGSVSDAVLAIRNGVALGQNPRKIAAAMRQHLQAPVWRAQRIARTEVMRAHREATFERYRDFNRNTASQIGRPLVEGWTWYAQTSSCCVACLAMHGTKHSLDERLDGHPNCRCVPLPTPVSWADLGYEGIDDEPDVLTGDQLLASMIEGGDLDRFGPGVRNALEAGTPLDAFVEQRFDPAWGSMRAQRPLGQVLQQ